MSEKNNNREYFIGLDVGTNSVGYAVTDTNYELLKYKGEPMWGVHLFDEANLKQERRQFRSARRRLDRRQQRVKMVQEIFAKEIAAIDPHFFTRIAESWRYPEETPWGASVFGDADYTDKQYHEEYPTIHHLICDLMKSEEPHDVRLVYLACAWLVAHRGHFLKEISEENIEDVKKFKTVYDDFIKFFDFNADGVKPWKDIENESQIEKVGEILKKKIGVNAKYGELSQLLYGEKKIPTGIESLTFPYSREGILKLLSGGEYNAVKLFDNEEYADLKLKLEMEEEAFDAALATLGDDAELLLRLKEMHDWAILSDILNGKDNISEAKVAVYNQHKADLKTLKYFIKKYKKESYDDVFRLSVENNYVAYSGNNHGIKKEDQKGKRANQEDFNTFVRKLFKNFEPQKADAASYMEMKQRLELNTFMPKQIDSDNRVIPYQVYLVELKKILKKASIYLPFLAEKDEDGYTNVQKILSIFKFRIPYFVGPLNQASEYAWMVRKAEGPIYPWNFDEKVDLDESERAFIDRMTNSCTYLPGEDVLPKASLRYQKFEVLNEINVLSVGTVRVTTECKQRIYNELFACKKKVTRKDISNFLIANGYCTKEEVETLAGIDDTVKSSLSSYIAFRKLLSEGQINEKEAEKIIERSTYAENKRRFLKWLDSSYPSLSQEDKEYLGALKCKDFGRLSSAFLCDFQVTDTRTGESATILEWMWNHNFNLMELQSDRFDFVSQIEKERREYYSENIIGLDEKLEEMYISNAVKRPILRTLDIVSDIAKATGHAPKKIFIEMARNTHDNGKKDGKRKKSRCEKLRELYQKIDTEDARDLTEQLNSMGEKADSMIQSEKLYLYYLQLGKCMYTGESISLARLSEEMYNIDHIYPQSKVKDDSLNNKVLVLSKINGDKKDHFPVDQDIREKMHGWWKMLLQNGLISEEKYRRLTRATPFSDDEKWGFINRQLVETQQSTKALARLLGDKYSATEIVYVKAGLVSEFRQEFDILKSRVVNDLHHAKDAYLNIAVGNVYHERFTKKWFAKNSDSYSIKVKTLFKQTVTGGNGIRAWDGEKTLGQVKRIVQNKNAVHLTKYAFCRAGQFYSQNPEKAAPRLIPLKKGLETEKYGGYNSPTASFYTLARFEAKGVAELMLVPINLLDVSLFDSSEENALICVKKQIQTITNQSVEHVTLPIGMRRIKINTVLDFDGIPYVLRGKASNGRQILLSIMAPLTVGYEWEKYIKHLERFVEKTEKNPSIKYSQEHDKISKEENIKLYDIFNDKLRREPYRSRPANPVAAIENGKSKFEKLEIIKQAKCLLELLWLFGTGASSPNLSLLGGATGAGTITLSSKLKNWMKLYRNVRIVDMSASGLYAKRSCNLFDLI